MNIIEIARQAGVRDDGHRFEFSEFKYLEQFAKLVIANIDPKSFMTWQEGYEVGVAHEREECAAVCFSIWNTWLDTPEEDRHKVLYDAEDCADAIRARGKA